MASRSSIPVERNDPLSQWPGLEQCVEALPDEDEKSFLVLAAVAPYPIVHASRAWLSACGYHSTEALGRTAKQLLQRPEEKNTHEVARLMAAASSARPVHVSLKNFTKTGEAFLNNLDVVPMGFSSPEARPLFFAALSDMTFYPSQASSTARRVAESKKAPVVKTPSDLPASVRDAYLISTSAQNISPYINLSSLPASQPTEKAASLVSLRRHRLEDASSPSSPTSSDTNRGNVASAIFPTGGLSANKPELSVWAAWITWMTCSVGLVLLGLNLGSLSSTLQDLDACLKFRKERKLVEARSTTISLRKTGRTSSGGVGLAGTFYNLVRCLLVRIATTLLIRVVRVSQLTTVV